MAINTKNIETVGQIRPRYPHCLLWPTLCICPELVLLRNRVRLTRLVQWSEYWRLSNTGRLAQLCIRPTVRQHKMDDLDRRPSAVDLLKDTKEFISMFTSEKREMRARRGGRVKSSQAYPKIRRELFESPTKSGDADSASQRKDTNKFLSKGRGAS